MRKPGHWKQLATKSGLVRENNRRGPQRRTLRFEPLEERQLLSVGPTLNISETWTQDVGQPWPSTWSCTSSSSGLTTNVQFDTLPSGSGGNLGCSAWTGSTGDYTYYRNDQMSLVNSCQTVQMGTFTQGHGGGAEGFGLKARGADTNTWYGVSVGYASSSFNLVKCVNGTTTTLATYTMPSHKTDNVWYNIEFYCHTDPTNPNATLLAATIWKQGDAVPRLGDCRVGLHDGAYRAARGVAASA